MANIVLGKPRKVEHLDVQIGEKTYKVPLAGSLKVRELSEMNTQEKTLDFLCRYIPKEVIDDLTNDDYNDLMAAWGDATKEASGKTLGE